MTVTAWCNGFGNPGWESSGAEWPGILGTGLVETEDRGRNGVLRR